MRSLEERKPLNENAAALNRKGKRSGSNVITFYDSLSTQKQYTKSHTAVVLRPTNAQHMRLTQSELEWPN